MPKAKPPRPAINAARKVPPRKRTVKMLRSRLDSMMLAPKIERAALAWRGPHLTGRLRYPRDAMITYRYGVLKPPRKKFVAIKLLAQQASSTSIKDRFADLTRLFHRKTDRERHLIMTHLATVDVAADAVHFEPSQIAQRLVGARDRPVDRA